MTKREENVFTMYKAVDTLIGTIDGRDLESLEAFDPARTRFSEAVTAIETKDIEYMSMTAGKALSKENIGEELCESIYEIGSALSLYAMSVGNVELKERVKFSKTELRRLRDTDLVRKGKEVNELAVTNGTSLGSYGITAERITAFGVMVNDYDAKLGDKEVSFADKTAARQELKDLFKAADTILKDEIDRYMEIIGGNSPDLYNQYKSARVIKDLGIRHEDEEPEEEEVQ